MNKENPMVRIHLAEIGISMRQAAGLIGTSHTTLLRWLAKPMAYTEQIRLIHRIEEKYKERCNHEQAV